MPDNIFEVRSNEVQEVLSRPPAAAIIWGNTIILAVLLTIVQLLHVIKLPVYIALKPQSIAADTVINNSPVLILAAATIPAEWYKSISKTNHIIIYSTYHVSSKEDAISYHVYDVKYAASQKQFELFYKKDQNKPLIEKSLIAGIDVQTGKLSLLKKFINALIL